MNTPIRLHLGCGLIHRPGWINLDLYRVDAADLQADALLLPFPDNAAEAIEARQLVEHLGYVGTLYALYEWARVLLPGGVLRIETPSRSDTLRAVADEQSGKAALSWLFGTEERGQGHRYLFSAEELLRMAGQAGFEALQVDVVFASPGHPTIRFYARRAATTPTGRFLSEFHRRLILCGILDPHGVPPYLAALETIARQASGWVENPGDEALMQLLSLSARYSPQVAACLLQALPDPSVWPAGLLAQAYRLLDDLERERFPARLACRWRTWPKLPGMADTAWALLEQEISLYLTARFCPGEGLDVQREALDATTNAFLPMDLSIRFFCRRALNDLARRLSAQGVRAWAQGKVAAAERAFQAALAYDPDNPWPRWNLARLYQNQGRRLEALAQYEVLQESLPAGLRPAFEQELDAVTGRLDGLDAFVHPLADLADLLEGGG